MDGRIYHCRKYGRIFMRNQDLHTNGLGFSCYSERLIKGFIETTNWISKISGIVPPFSGASDYL